jgi:hypothetical protein
VPKALTPTNRTKWLTRKTGKQNIEVRNLTGFDLSDVTVGPITEVTLVCPLGEFVPFTTEHAPTTSALKRNPHSAYASKKVNEAEMVFRMALLRLIPHK